MRKTIVLFWESIHLLTPCKLQGNQKMLMSGRFRCRFWRQTMIILIFKNYSAKPDAYSQPCQTSKRKRFAEIVNR